MDSPPHPHTPRCQETQLWGEVEVSGTRLSRLRRRGGGRSSPQGVRWGKERAWGTVQLLPFPSRVLNRAAALATLAPKKNLGVALGEWRDGLHGITSLSGPSSWSRNLSRVDKGRASRKLCVAEGRGSWWAKAPRGDAGMDGGDATRARNWVGRRVEIRAPRNPIPSGAAWGLAEVWERWARRRRRAGGPGGQSAGARGQALWDRGGAVARGRTSPLPPPIHAPHSRRTNDLPGEGRTSPPGNGRRSGRTAARGAGRAAAALGRLGRARRAVIGSGEGAGRGRAGRAGGWGGARSRAPGRPGSAPVKPLIVRS